jgi:hypothetical protein
MTLEIDMLRDFGKRHSCQRDKTPDNSKGCLPAKDEISATFNRILYRANGVEAKNVFVFIRSIYPMGFKIFHL